VKDAPGVKPQTAPAHPTAASIPRDWWEP
jgi:hypothetical protein